MKYSLLDFWTTFESVRFRFWITFESVRFSILDNFRISPFSILDNFRISPFFDFGQFSNQSVFELFSPNGLSNEIARNDKAIEVRSEIIRTG